MNQIDPKALFRLSIDELPLYPEQRQCAHPTTEQVLRLFSLTQRHRLADQRGLTIQIFDAELTSLQIQILALLGVPPESFHASVCGPEI